MDGLKWGKVWKSRKSGAKSVSDGNGEERGIIVVEVWSTDSSTDESGIG